MKNLIFLLCLVSVIAFGQKTDVELNTQNNNTIFTATLTPTRVGNMFEQSILSKVNKRTPEFLDSADITKRIKWFLHGSHPTGTTYNVTLPNKSGTVAFLDDIVGMDTTLFWKVRDTTKIISNAVVDMIFTDDTDSISLFIQGDWIADHLVNPYPLKSKTYIGWSTGNIEFGVRGTDDNGKIVIVGSQYDSADFNYALRILDTRGEGFNNGLIYASTPLNPIGESVMPRSYNDTRYPFRSILVSDGDFYMRSSGSINRLSKGVEGTLLRAGSTLPAYSTFTIPDTISALSTFVANSANVLTEITPAAGQSIRVNAGGTAWEVYTPSSGGVSDGDKGDITVSGSGATWTIDTAAVTYAKIQNVAANSFLANATGSGATVQEIATNRIPLFSSAITGTPSSSTYLRGDGSWQTISGGIGGSTGSTDNAILVADGTGGSTLQASGLTIDGDRIGSSTNIELDAADSVLVIGDDANEVILGKNTAGQRLGYLEINVENSIVMRSESPVNITSYGQSFTSLESSIGISPDSAAYVSNTTFPTIQQANASYFGAKDVDGSSDLFSLSESGVEINLSGKLTPKVESGTSFTIDASHIAQGTYTSNGSAVTVTVPSGLQTGSVIIIMQEGAGTVTLSAGANVVLSGKTSTTGATDFIWLWLYKKDSGDSYYVGR
jgi:hypothetical protein